MTKDPNKWASISVFPTHGTATLVQQPSVIPADKRDCEVFWVSNLLPSLKEMQPLKPNVESCPDDSHGNHDVIISLNDGNEIGIQVTELTYELERARKSQRDRFLADVSECYRIRKLSPNRKLLVNCFLPFVTHKQYKVPNPMDVVDATANFISQSIEHDIVDVGPSRVTLQWVEEGEFYVPSVDKIGIDCNLDALPRTLDMYSDAVSSIYEKKSDSKSPWLLIWSQTFCRDKHWLGDNVLQHMRETFKPSHFTRVFFIESLDGLGLFEANLSIHEIKNP